MIFARFGIKLKELLTIIPISVDNIVEQKKVRNTAF